MKFNFLLEQFESLRERISCLINPSHILGGAGVGPSPSFFPIIFDRVWISKWNFASVYKIWIDIFTKNFVIIGDVIDPWWRHRFLKMPPKGPPSNSFSCQYFCSSFACRLPIRCNFGVWGQFFAACHVRVFYRPAPKPFLPKLALIFYISGLENGINMKFGPGLGNDNLRLHAKFQVDLTTCCPESE